MSEMDALNANEMEKLLQFQVSDTANEYYDLTFFASLR